VKVRVVAVMRDGSNTGMRCVFRTRYRFLDVGGLRIFCREAGADHSTALLLLHKLRLGNREGHDKVADIPGLGIRPDVRVPNCVGCHGAKGKGDGVAAVALNPKPADWTSGTVQADTDGELFWKISTGRGAMPPWKQLSENDRWAVVRYIRTLAGK
jgi:cytochrome c553